MTTNHVALIERSVEVRALVGLIGAILHKHGPEITVTEEDFEAIKGMGVMIGEWIDGKQTVSLAPPQGMTQ